MKYTHDEKDKQVYQFTDILSRNGITISASSALERLCYDVLELNQRHKYPQLRNPNEDFRGYFRDVLGFSDFIAKICNVAQLPNFTVLLPHLKLMAEALNNSTIPQTTSSLSGDMISNQLFELYVGSVCLACACFSNVELEQPTGSTQPSTNPDILFDFEMERWAIACKVLHTRNPLTLINNIEKGVEQIERCKQARRGVVLVNIRNIIDFDEFLPILNEGSISKRRGRTAVGCFP